MLDLFCRRPVPPAGWKLGDWRHAWERDNAAVLSAYAELALSLERGACHRSAMWPAGDAVASTRARGPYLPRTSARPVVPAPFLSTGSRAGAGVSGSLFGFRSRAPGRSPLPRALIFPVPVAPTHKAGSHAIARTQADVWELVNFCAPLTLPDPL